MREVTRAVRPGLGDELICESEKRTASIGAAMIPPMFIELDDGRKLSYQEQGQKSGTPIFMLHGTPGSRLWFSEDDPVTLDMGVRAIYPDRPGYGLSDFHPSHSFSNYAEDLRQLADALDIEEFYVMGVSGGGAFAAACSRYLEDRVKGSALVSSSCPNSYIESHQGMSMANRVAFWLAKNFPLGLKVITGISRKIILRYPERYLKEIKGQLCEWDQKVLEQPVFQKLAVLHLQEAYRQGVQGATHELGLQTSDWGFRLEDITTKTDVWHGQEDTLAPHFMGEVLAQRLAHSTFYSIPTAGHLLSDEPNFRKEIWAALIQG